MRSTPKESGLETEASRPWTHNHPQVSGERIVWREALVVWLVVFVVEFAVGYGLALAGMMSLEAFT